MVKEKIEKNSEGRTEKEWWLEESRMVVIVKIGGRNGLQLNIC